MKSDFELQSDQERLLEQRAYKINSRGKPARYTPCQWTLIALGLILLFALGNVAGLFGLLRIPSIKSYLAPPTNSSETLPKLQDLGAVVLPTILGTNESAPLFNPSTPRNGSITRRAAAGIDNQNTQPVIPIVKDGACSYDYLPHLTTAGGKLPRADFIRATNTIEISDVQQGGIGDCGFGASLISLIANGQRKEILDALELKDLGRMVAHFLVWSAGVFVPGTDSVFTIKEVRVEIDDRLAIRSQESSSECFEFISFVAGLDANGRRNVFVPLLEKAFSKFLDSDEGPTNNFDGYAGLTGVLARNVLASFTGGYPRIYEKSAPGLDLKMASVLVQCVNLRRACVIGVPPPTDFRVGTPVGDTSIINSPAGQITIHSNKKSLTLRETGTDREVNIVGSHYYGFEMTQFIDGKTITFENAEVILHNPWACNVDTQGVFTCDGRGLVRVKLSSLPIVATGVEWAEPLKMGYST